MLPSQLFYNFLSRLVGSFSLSLALSFEECEFKPGFLLFMCFEVLFKQTWVNHLGQILLKKKKKRGIQDQWFFFFFQVTKWLVTFLCLVLSSTWPLSHVFALMNYVRLVNLNYQMLEKKIILIIILRSHLYHVAFYKADICVTLVWKPPNLFWHLCITCFLSYCFWA